MTGQTHSHSLHIVAGFLGQRPGKWPVGPDRLKLFALTCDDLVQIHGQIGDRADLKFSRFGDQLAPFIGNVDIDSLGILLQISSVMRPVAQCLGSGMAGGTGARLAVGGMRHGGGHIDTALAFIAPAFLAGLGAPDFIVDQGFPVGCDNGGDLLTAGYQRADAAFTVDTQNRIFPAQI